MKKVQIPHRRHFFMKKNDIYTEVKTNPSNETETKTYTWYDIGDILKKMTIVTVIKDTQGITESNVNKRLRNRSETTSTPVFQLTTNPENHHTRSRSTSPSFGSHPVRNLETHTLFLRPTSLSSDLSDRESEDPPHTPKVIRPVW